MKYALATIGGKVIESNKFRLSETGVLADFWTRYKLKGYYSDEQARAEMKTRGLEVRAVEVSI